jgi:hypothetical protein
MDPSAPELIKHREICFCQLHPDPQQAQTAMLLLAGIDGVLRVQLVGPACLHVSYHLSRISLRNIEEALLELGFHLESDLLSKLKRALFYYTEETQRANAGCDCGNASCIRQVFVSRYQRLRHGCRDGRPQHWRSYL